MKKEKKVFYALFSAVLAMLLTAAAISASIIYVLRNTGENGRPREGSYLAEVFAVTDESIPLSADGAAPVVTTSVSTAPRDRYVQSFKREGTFTTYYGTFVPIESVMDINEYLTVNPVILSEEDTKLYICSDGGDCDAVMEDIRALSDEICRGAGAESDYEKAYALAMWVGLNVAYDHDAAANRSDLSVTCLKAVLDNDFRTTCGGFSNLYSALCYCQGIYCLNMKGGSSAEGWEREQLEEAPANHEWNAVYIDGQWYYSDCTWISDRSYSGGEFTEITTRRDFYALFGFGEMSVEHRADRCEYRSYGIEIE